VSTRLTARILSWLLIVAGSAARVAAQAEDEAQDDSAAPAPEASAQSASELHARLSVGAGLGMRSIEVPSSEGLRKLETGLIPVAGIRVAGRFRDGSHFLGLRLSYQSGVHTRAIDDVGDHSLVASEVAIRSHRFEGGLLPGLILSRERSAGSLALFAGYGLRAFGSVEVVRVPRFTLHGPVLRLELTLPLVDWLRLRLAPEAQLVLSMSEALRNLANLPTTAFGFGGEADLQARWSPTWSAQISYRESHVRATGLEARQFTDAERYLLLELTYQVE